MYGFTTTLTGLTFEQALEETTEALMAEGRLRRACAALCGTAPQG